MSTFTYLLPLHTNHNRVVIPLDVSGPLVILWRAMILKPTQSSPLRFLTFSHKLSKLNWGLDSPCNICTAGCSSICQASAAPQDEHSEGSCLDNQQHYRWKQHSNPGYLRIGSNSEMFNQFWPTGGYGCRGPAAPHWHPCQGQYLLREKN